MNRQLCAPVDVAAIHGDERAVVEPVWVELRPAVGHTAGELLGSVRRNSRASS
jgi:hypothetical protein